MENDERDLLLGMLIRGELGESSPFAKKRLSEMKITLSPNLTAGFYRGKDVPAMPQPKNGIWII